MRSILVFLVAGSLLVAAAPVVLSQNAADGDAGSLLDDLFSEPQTEEGQEGEGEPEASDEPASLLDSVLAPEPLELTLASTITAGYSGGATSGRTSEYVQLPVISLASRLRVVANISPALSVTTAASVNYPSYEPSVEELRFDYSLEEALFFTLGLTAVAWGRSPNFHFADLPARIADNPLSAQDRAQTIVARARFPIDRGGLDVLIKNRSDYHADPLSPQVQRLGYGIRYDLASERLDADVGFYLQSGLAGRAFLSATTTLADAVELYGEAVYADARLRFDDTKTGGQTSSAGYEVEDSNPDVGAAVGIILSLLDGSADLNAEYFYNGEETESGAVGVRFPLMWGHNAAINLITSFGGSPFTLRAGVRHNFTMMSGIFAPQLSVRAARHLTASLSGAVIWGPGGIGYSLANPDPSGRSALFAVTVSLSGEL